MDGVYYELCNYLEKKFGLYVHVGEAQSFGVQLIFMDNKIEQNYIMELWTPREIVEKRGFMSVYICAHYKLESLVRWNEIKGGNNHV